MFAPGHLGELTQVIPFDLVDGVLADTRATQRRLRALPSRVGVYFVLALGLFPRAGYLGVWAKLTAALDGLGPAVPSARALRGLRRRLGPAPFRGLFEVLAGPAAWPRTPGVMFGRYRTVAFDGCKSVKVPDTPRNRAWLGKMNPALGVTGYPVIQLMTLCETGTRALIGAAFGTPADGEITWARKMLHLLDESMLVLMDRGFDGGQFLAEVAATRAQFLVRLTSTRRLPVLGHLPDGSFLSLIGGVKVRIIEASVTVTCHDGTRYAGSYRLATTLTNWRAYPAGPLIVLYHERWEHEIAYLALRHTLLQGRVLRSGDPTGLEQGNVGAARPLPGAADRHHRRHPGHSRHRPRPRQLPDRRRDSHHPGHPGLRRHLRHHPSYRTDRPRRPCQPARAPPAPGLRPPGQIPALPLEQAPARQARHQPEDHHDQYRDPPGPSADSGTPPQVLDTRDRSLTPRH